MTGPRTGPPGPERPDRRHAPDNPDTPSDGERTPKSGRRISPLSSSQPMDTVNTHPRLPAVDPPTHRTGHNPPARPVGGTPPPPGFGRRPAPPNGRPDAPPPSGPLPIQKTGAARSIRPPEATGARRPIGAPPPGGAGQPGQVGAPPPGGARPAGPPPNGTRQPGRMPEATAAGQPVRSPEATSGTRQPGRGPEVTNATHQPAHAPEGTSGVRPPGRAPEGTTGVRQPAHAPEGTSGVRPPTRAPERTTGVRPEPPRGPGQPARTPEASGTVRVPAQAAGERPVPENPLDTPANATAARLIAEGRARMAGRDEETDSAAKRRRDRRDRPRFDPASLASLPEVFQERFEGYRHRRRAKLAGYSPTQLRWHRIRLFGGGALGIFVVLPILMFFFGYLFFSIPTPDDAVNKQIATISYSDGTDMARIVPAEGNRIKVTIDQIPPHVRYAVLSAEDRSFFSNPGFDPIGLARAAWKQLTGGAGGGSTITQQFVKKTLVGDEHSLWRKYKEMIIAVKISQQSSKEEILASYLNAIYYGRGAYGIQSASQAYFGKNVWELNVAQAAVLASVIQSPSRWDPAINPQRAQERWNFVLNGMVAQGWLTAEQRAQARFPMTQAQRKVSGGIPGDSRGVILSAIKDELERRGISEQQFSQDGLHITTTIDPEAQQHAVDAVKEGLSGQPENLRTALVSIDPKTGGVLAYYGGDNGVGLDYARVSKQPGSTFKPFVLLAALQQPEPIGLGTQFKGEALPWLRNSDGASCTLCDLKQAMTISNNVIFHELAGRVGPQRVADAARAAGITSPLNNADAGIALGNKEVTTVELASAYATLAAQGVYRPPHLVSKVTTSDDRVIYEAVHQDQQRFDGKVARNVVEAMLGVPTYDKLGLGGGRAVAAKTGTVQSRVEGQNNDAWIGGFTPGVATVVWIGTDQNTPIKTAKGNPITGATMPGSIWKSFMTDAVKSTSAESFGQFKAIGTPPAVTGPYDGYAAQSPQAAPPTLSTLPSSAPVPFEEGTSPDAAPPEREEAPRDCEGDDCDNERRSRDRAQPEEEGTGESR
ncbi:hypothetical protein GCM10023321_58320 [Pseudonocardia eucalypti]|uniref:Penicillin-insensitive transglycosylase n=1 Tax=Pseudonocardia eucalypti TaxID=648755 RepID=A0ABP9QSS2_9PSEU|nr:membrane peptidoglycan carboxypeptidase [Pseudonocardia eucalypti]